MTELSSPYTVTRQNGQADLKALRAAIERFRYPDEDEAAQMDALREIADSIEEQVKPTIEEPTGDVVVLDAMSYSWIYDDETKRWLNDAPLGSSRTWEELLAEFADPPKVYRHDVEVLRIGVGEASADADEDMTAAEFDARMEASTPVEVNVNLGRTYTKQPLAEWETEFLNQQHRREVAVDVLTAMDVDQYLIDAVANARPR